MLGVWIGSEEMWHEDRYVKETGLREDQPTDGIAKLQQLDTCGEHSLRDDDNEHILEISLISG